MKTIFFGPWIGEFGWEYSHWHAWVNHVSRNEFKKDITIAASFKGREPFYKDTSKFLSHPKKFDQLFKGKRNYITDNWINDRPNFNNSPDNKAISSKTNVQNQIEIAKDLLSHYKKNLPEETVFYVPWLLNKIHLENRIIKIGIEDLGYSIKKKKVLELLKYILINRISNFFLDQSFKYRINGHLYQEGIATHPIPLDRQQFFKLTHIEKIPSELLDQVDGKFEKKIISIFPRRRDERRPDKNFGEKKYIDLIQKIQERFPKFKIALLGEPNGSYFTKGVPEGCIDLINISNENRMNNQIYVLENSIFAIGSISGAMLVSLGTGCPSLIWGFHDAKIPTHDNNPLLTPMHYISSMHPKVSDILAGIEDLKIKANIDFG